MSETDSTSLDSPSSSAVKVYSSRGEVPYLTDLHTGIFPGAHGAVYRATEGPDHSVRCVSSFRQEVFAIREVHYQGDRARSLIEEEIERLRTYRHPNLLRLEDVYTVYDDRFPPQDVIFLVTKPWEPVSLERLFLDLARSRCRGRSSICPWYRLDQLEPWPGIISGCMEGLQYLHSQGIVHKNLRPENILLCDETDHDLTPVVRPIIADFGFGTEYTSSRDRTFDNDYKAPEQVDAPSGMAFVGSDVFSLGCCFALIESILYCEDVQQRFVAGLVTRCHSEDDTMNVHRVLQVHIARLPDSTPILRYFGEGFRKQVAEIMQITRSDRPGMALASLRFENLRDQVREYRRRSYLELCITIESKTKLVEIEFDGEQSDFENERLMDRVWKEYRQERDRIHGCMGSLEYTERSFHAVKFEIRLDPKDGARYRTREGEEDPHRNYEVTVKKIEPHFLPFATAKDRQDEPYRFMSMRTHLGDRTVPIRMGQSAVARLRHKTSPEALSHILYDNRVEVWGMEITEAERHLPFLHFLLRVVIIYLTYVFVRGMVHC